eukprot:11184734-Lingulodinium_polyedra.AAC.1
MPTASGASRGCGSSSLGCARGLMMASSQASEDGVPRTPGWKPRSPRRRPCSVAHTSTSSSTTSTRPSTA